MPDMLEKGSAIPIAWERLPESVMSNFDHDIEQSVADELQARENTYAQYAGWDFCGYVWWDRESSEWACEVWTYNTPREVVRADTLLGIMDEVCGEYGSD